MSILAISFLLLGSALVVVSFFARGLAVRIFANVIGISLLVWLACGFGGILGLYAQEHREVENQYHQQIIRELDRMLAEGNTEAARNLTRRYLRETKGSSFMRNPLHDIVESLEKAGTEQGDAGDAVHPENAIGR
jgi:hypothetical protein